MSEIKRKSRASSAFKLNGLDRSRKQKTVIENKYLVRVTKFLQTVWKRRRIEDGRAWWGFWLVFAIFCPKLLLILLALSGMR